MEDSRKGVLTPEQEKIVDDLAKFKGVMELVDGHIVSLADNKGLEALKKKAVEKWGPEILPTVYEFIDMLFIPLKAIAEAKKEE